MPFVNIRIVEEVIASDPEGIKSKVSDLVTNAISDTAGVPKENVWVVFEEVSHSDWFSGGVSVKDLMAQS